MRSPAPGWPRSRSSPTRATSHPIRVSWPKPCGPSKAPSRSHDLTPSLTVSFNLHAWALSLEAAGAARQDVDEADGETAPDGGDGVRHVPFRPDGHRAAGNRGVAQVP